jgi:hypothetical protein
MPLTLYRHSGMILLTIPHNFFWTRGVSERV